MQERIISGRERDEDIEDEVEMYAKYVPDPDVQERQARAQSRAEAWEGDQRAAHRVSFHGDQHEVGSGSGSGSAVGASGTQSRRFSNVRDYFTRPPPTQTQLPEQGRHSKRPTCVQIEDVDSYVYPREHGKQTRIEDAYNQQGPKYKVGRAIAKWWHHTGLTFNAANSPYYKTAIQEMKSFREAMGGFAEPSAIAGRERVEGERGEYELDEEADDPEDPPRPNTFLARAVAEATTEEEGDRGNVGQPYSPHYEMDPEAEVDLLGDIELEHVERTIGGGHGHDDDDGFQMLMEGLPCTQSRRRGSSTQDAPPSQSTRAPTSSQLAKGKQIAQESRQKKTGATESRPSKRVVIREPPPPPVQKKKSWFSGWGSKKGKKCATLVEDPLDIADAETLDPNAEDDTPSPLDLPRLPNSASHDSMTTGGSSSDAGGDGGGNGGGGGGGGGRGGDGGQGGGDGDNGQGGGGGGMAFTEEQFYRGATQDSSHGAPLWYNRRQKFRPGSQARGEPVDSHSYDTMISDFERMSTQESVGSYGGHSYHPESTSTDYSSGYRLYSGYTATTGYLSPSPYMYPPPAFSVPVPVQVFPPLEDVQMAQLNIVRPGSQVWDHYLSQFRQRYHTMMTWDEYRSFVSQTKGHHLIGELPSESDESESVPIQSQWNAYDPYQQGHWEY
ncbi:hypothetical protein Taro_004450 [Colocasia esculenta]|uniref:Uncharacterized protein n=1 Tax=Colocasia esculenta TaxID=4460 RepID=A0A843TK58_COLES|nr:hypothetical protein [Colocasia esculenta]